MIKALLLSTLLNPEFSELRIEARRRSKGNKKRRRGGNGLR